MKSSEVAPRSADPLAMNQLNIEQQERLAELLDRYLTSLEQATPLDPRAMIEAHPDLAESLRSFLESLEELHAAATGFQDASPVESAEAAEAGQKGVRTLCCDFSVGRASAIMGITAGTPVSRRGGLENAAPAVVRRLVAA